VSIRVSVEIASSMGLVICVWDRVGIGSVCGVVQITAWNADSCGTTATPESQIRVDPKSALTPDVQVCSPAYDERFATLRPGDVHGPASHSLAIRSA